MFSNIIIIIIIITTIRRRSNKRNPVIISLSLTSRGAASVTAALVTLFIHPPTPGSHHDDDHHDDDHDDDHDDHDDDHQYHHRHRHQHHHGSNDGCYIGMDEDIIIWRNCVPWLVRRITRRGPD